ncbi:MAG: nucleotidyltransferase family protein [Candidatus Altiarchaeota archaeon]|nr:nucleotidyltransferase family protein [Candidatus Altiarchaeota archaeon]
MVKKRISLTIDEQILRKADRLIGKLADNRSVVFEKLLEKSFFTLTPKTAIILIGSKRENLLLEDYKGKKVIEYHRDNLEIAGVTKIVFVGQEISEIRDYLKDKEGDFLYITDDDAGTGGAIKQASHLLSEKFFLIYGDTVNNIDYSDLYRFHTEQKVMATVALTTVNEPHKYGTAELKGSKVVGFKEKPVKTKNYLVSSGSFVMEPEVLELIGNGRVSLEKNILPKLSSISQLSGYLFSGKWVDLGKISN